MPELYVTSTLVVSVMLMAAMCIIVFLQAKCSKYSRVLLDEVMDASVDGKLLFDASGALLKHNIQASLKLSEIFEGDLSTLTKSDFVNCLFDHAVDLDSGMRKIMMDDAYGPQPPEFREVIDCKDQGVCVVNARKLSSDLTLFVLVDISSDQKREQSIDQLNTENNHLVHAIQAATSGIVVSNVKEDGNPILFANDAFCDLLNMPRDVLMGGGWDTVLPCAHDISETEKLSDALANFRNTEVALTTHNDNITRHFTLRIAPVYDEDGEHNSFVGILSEVTLLKQREAEFFQAQKLESLGQISAGVAHDFNNILSIIGGYTHMASRATDNEDAKVYLRKVDTAAERGASLTRKMLAFSKQKVITKSVIDVRNVVHEQKELLLPLLSVSVNIGIVVPDDPACINASADGLGQVLMNLAINARDAMQDGGTVMIEVLCLDADDVPEKIRTQIQSDEYIAISVSDSGVGMSEETMERIFDPFFSTKEQGKGTGLGLSVVYGLVNEMGGALDVRSHLGRGTKISVFIPKSNQPITKIIKGDVNDVSTIRLEGYKVLVVEDEPDLLDLMTQMLEQTGLNVLTAADGDEALILQEGVSDKIDLLLTDIVMPTMNGVKLADLLTSIRPETQVVFMSGYPADGDMAPVEIPDGAAFIAKPVDYEKLVTIIYQTLKGEVVDVGADVMKTMPRWETSESGKG